MVSVKTCFTFLWIFLECLSCDPLCYELSDSNCYDRHHDTYNYHPFGNDIYKQCSIWSGNVGDQCICTTDQVSGVDIYFLLDTTNINLSLWRDIFAWIPSSLLSTCLQLHSNLYIVQYSDNQTNLTINPSVSDLSVLQPFQYGTFSTFCETLRTVDAYMQQQTYKHVHPQGSNPIVLVPITSNAPDDAIGVDGGCEYGIEQLMARIVSVYGIYVGDHDAPLMSKYEQILSFHDGFQMHNMHQSASQEISNRLVTAILCETVCGLTATATATQSTAEVEYAQPLQGPPSPLPTAFNIWPRQYYKSNWNSDSKSESESVHVESKKTKAKLKKKKTKKKRHKTRYHHSSWSSSSSSSRTEHKHKTYEYDRYDWNARRSIH